MRQTFRLDKLAGNISDYAKTKNYIERVYLQADGKTIRVFFFVNDLNRFPEGIEALEDKLNKSFNPYSFTTRVVPYEPKAVEDYAEIHDLLPVSV